MVFLFVRVWLLCCGVVVVFLVLGFFFFLGFSNWFWIVLGWDQQLGIVGEMIEGFRVWRILCK